MFSKNNIESNNHYLYVLISAMFLGFISYVANFAAGVPTIICPFSFVVFIPFLFLSLIIEKLSTSLSTLTIILSCTVTPIFYMLWSRKLYNDKNKIPRRSIVLFSILLVFSFIYLMRGWNEGLRYQGKQHILAMYGLNLLFWIIMIVLYFVNKERPTFKTNFIFHWVSFSWLIWVAFPWLGELL